MDDTAEYQFWVGRSPHKYLRCLRHCGHCQRVEFMNNAGPFVWKCDECQGLVSKTL